MLKVAVKEEKSKLKETEIDWRLFQFVHYRVNNVKVRSEKCDFVK